MVGLFVVLFVCLCLLTAFGLDGVMGLLCILLIMFVVRVVVSCCGLFVVLF